MRLNLYRVIGFLTIVLLGGLPAYADGIHLCPFNSNTCNANGVIPVARQNPAWFEIKSLRRFVSSRCDVTPERCSISCRSV
jgi:hypothetical protein